jgi:hypothetical protein
MSRPLRPLRSTICEGSTPKTEKGADAGAGDREQRGRRTPVPFHFNSPKLFGSAHRGMAPPSDVDLLPKKDPTKKAQQTC